MTLYYYEEMTMREIGLALGVVESRVSQVHASAVVHLRSALKDLAARGAFEKARSAPARRQRGRRGILVRAIVRAEQRAARKQRWLWERMENETPEAGEN